MLTVKSASDFLTMTQSIFLYIDTCIKLFPNLLIKHERHPFSFISESLTRIHKV